MLGLAVCYNNMEVGGPLLVCYNNMEVGGPLSVMSTDLLTYCGHKIYYILIFIPWVKESDFVRTMLQCAKYFDPLLESHWRSWPILEMELLQGTIEGNTRLWRPRDVAQQPKRLDLLDSTQDQLAKDGGWSASLSRDEWWWAITWMKNRSNTNQDSHKLRWCPPSYHRACEPRLGRC